MYSRFTGGSGASSADIHVSELTMARAVKINYLGVVARYSEAMGKLRKPGDCVSVVRGTPRAIVMSCPDGCGETLTINLDRRIGPAWRKYEKNDHLTVYPSVWRESGCRAHFIIWRNSILWCGPSEDYVGTHTEEHLLPLVLAKLSTTTYRHYEVIADALEINPWEVFWACKDLVRAGKAEQGKTGMFRATRRQAPPRSSGLDFYA